MREGRRHRRRHPGRLLDRTGADRHRDRVPRPRRRRRREHADALPGSTLAVASQGADPAASRPAHAGDAAGAAVPDLTLLWWMFTDRPGAGFNALAPALLALIPFIVMFLVTSVTTLRERTSRNPRAAAGDAARQGRLPARLRARVRGGRSGAVRAGRRACASGSSTWTSPGPVWVLLVVAVADAVLGTALGLFVSRVRAHRVPGRAVHAGPGDPADPAVRAVRPPRGPARLPHGVSTCCRCPTRWTRWTRSPAARDPAIAGDLAVVAGFAVAALVLGALTLRRQTP